MQKIINLSLETLFNTTAIVVITVLFHYIFIFKYIYHSTAIVVCGDMFSNLSILLNKKNLFYFCGHLLDYIVN